MLRQRVIDGVLYEELGGSLIPVGEAEIVGNGSRNGSGDGFISLAGMKPRPIRWAWLGRIPLGVATVISGMPGAGKTHIALHIGGKATRGELPGDLAGKPCSIVVMSREDVLEETIIPRLIADGADTSRVFALPFTSGSFDVAKDMPKLEAVVAREGVRIVILDPLLAFMAGDTFKENEVRRALEPAQRLMQDYRLAMIGVMHVNKDVMKDMLHRVTSSGAFTALVRSVLFVGDDPDDDDELNPSKVLAHGKINLGRKAPSISFDIRETTVEGENEDGEPCEVPTSTVVILGDSEITAEQLLKGRGSAGTKLAQAEALLRRMCPAGKVTIITEAERLGISRVTVERAYQRLGGEPGAQERDPQTGRMASAIWRLEPAHAR